MDETEAVAREAWRSAAELIRAGAHRLVVLDEIAYPMNWGWISTAEVVETIRSRPDEVSVIVTGRDAPAELREIADTVTEMVAEKHAFDRGHRRDAGDRVLMPFTFLLGGARSGKSALAVEAAAAQAAPVVVIATAEARDDEMASRIRDHRAARPAEWSTIEAPLGLLDAVRDARDDGFVLLDCLTLWVSNALEAGATEEAIEGEAHALSELLAAASRGVGRGQQRGRPRHRAGERARQVVPGRARAGERRVRGARGSRLLRRRRPRDPARRGRARVSLLLDATIAAIEPRTRSVAERTRRLLDAKTKPPGSLGRLEDLACRLASIRGSIPDRPPRPAIVVAAADHGVAVHGVSAYPPEVTAQMLANFAGGGAAISVLARQAQARLVVVDAGVAAADPIAGVRLEVVGGVRGTADLTRGPAMPRDVALGLIDGGIALADELAGDGVEIVGVGEMGIGNTTAASALASVLLPADPALLCGPGTGLDPAGVTRKVEAVRRGLEANGLPRPGADPADVLAAVGGLEIAFLVGVILGAAARRVPVLLDGFITGASALSPRNSPHTASVR